MASSARDGVLVDDGMSEGEGGKGERSGSKFRNSLQSESKVGTSDCSISSCGISNKLEKSASDATGSMVGSKRVDVNVMSPTTLERTHPG